MTLFGFVHYGLFVLVCVRAAWIRWRLGQCEKSFRAVKGALVAALYCYIVMALVVPSEKPVFWFAVGHAIAAGGFLLGGISRVGHWITLLMCGQFFIDIATIAGHLPLAWHPFFNGVTWITLLVLVILADMDRGEYEPFKLALARALRRAFRGGHRDAGDDLPSDAGATKDTRRT